jgi:hypothetical protein
MYRFSGWPELYARTIGSSDPLFNCGFDSARELGLPGGVEIVQKYRLRLLLKDDINTMSEAQTPSHGVVQALRAFGGPLETERLQRVGQDIRKRRARGKMLAGGSRDGSAGAIVTRAHRACAKACE